MFKISVRAGGDHPQPPTAPRPGGGLAGVKAPHQGVNGLHWQWKAFYAVLSKVDDFATFKRVEVLAKNSTYYKVEVVWKFFYFLESSSKKIYVSK